MVSSCASCVGLCHFTIVGLLFLTQLQALSVRNQNVIDDSSHHVRSLAGSQMTLKKLNCILSRCSGRSGSALEICSHMCEEPAITTRSIPCVATHCHQYTGVYRDLCEFTKCTLAKANVNENAVNPMAAKRYNFDEIMWPDEFETRSSEEHQERTNRVRARRMSSEETELDRERKDLEQGRPVHSQGCSTVCHGFTGKQYEHCMTVKCKDGRAKAPPIALKKRWSTRLCMETHCQGAGNKVEYFMCGKMNCH